MGTELHWNKEMSLDDNSVHGKKCRESERLNNKLNVTNYNNVSYLKLFRRLKII